MTADTQFHLEVVNGTVVKQEGYFFKAAPFEIITDQCQLTIQFTRNKNFKVVYQVNYNQETVVELEHPDYDVSDDPTALCDHDISQKIPAINALFSALTHLDITKNKLYKAHFSDSENIGTYIVKQSSFLN